MPLFKNLFGGNRPPKPLDNALLLFLREPITFNRDLALETARRAFNRDFPGGDSPWYVVCINDYLATISTAQHSLNLFKAEHPEWDNDKATDVLPPVEERKAWAPYQQRLESKLVTGSLGNPAARNAMAVKLALPLIDWLGANCIAFYDSYNRVYMPNTPETLAQLRQFAAAAPE